MKKHIQELTVLYKQWLSKEYFVLHLSHEKPLPEILPGQFAELLVENNSQVFLRRPISIHDVDYEKNSISLLIRVVGEGTRTLSLLETGDLLNMVYPLGNTFSIDGVSNALLVGGGCGIAPMLFLVRKLKENNIPLTTLIGGRNEVDILEHQLFATFGNVCISTDDGSLGEKGFLTKNSVMQNLSDFDRIYCCGPEPMMKVVASIAKQHQINCEVSLENTMACGFGACLCCVTETIHGNKCVCTEGPVFNVNQLKWQI